MLQFHEDAVLKDAVWNASRRIIIGKQIEQEHQHAAVDLILALIEEYRAKKKGDKNAKLTRFLLMNA